MTADTKQLFWTEYFFKLEATGEDLVKFFVEFFELSIRIKTCLINAYLYEAPLQNLTNKTRVELLKEKNFGRKSCTDLERCLEAVNLRLNMPRSEFDFIVSQMKNECYGPEEQDAKLSQRTHRKATNLVLMVMGRFPWVSTSQQARIIACLEEAEKISGEDS